MNKWHWLITGRLGSVYPFLTNLIYRSKGHLRFWKYNHHYFKKVRNLYIKHEYHIFSLKRRNNLDSLTKICREVVLELFASFSKWCKYFVKKTRSNFKTSSWWSAIFLSLRAIFSWVHLFYMVFYVLKGAEDDYAWNKVDKYKPTFKPLSYPQ